MVTIMREFLLDMDGVFVAFDQYFLKRYGVCPASATSEMWKDFWYVAVPKDKAFEVMETEIGGMELWNFFMKRKAMGDKISILTASGFGKAPTAPMQKYQWCVKHLPGFDADMFNFVDRSEDKAEVIKTKPDAILVDDMLNNVKDWVDAGGDAIHHRHTETTISEINYRFGG